MAKELFWSEDGESVYGLASDFTSEEDFIESVKNEYEDGECEVVDIKVEPCLCAEDTIYGDCIMPLSCVSATIEDYYIAMVQPLHD